MKNNKESCVCSAKTSIGGQALMEGIMMRGPKHTAMAVRNPKGEIVVEEWDNAVNKRPSITKKPVIRGVFNFVDSMILGYKCLMRSAEISGLEEASEELERERLEKKKKREEKKRAKKQILPENCSDSKASEAVVEETCPECEKKCDDILCDTEENILESENLQKNSDNKKAATSPFVNVVMVVSMVLGVALALGLFFFLPNWISTLILGEDAPTKHPALLSVLSTVIKLVLLVGYMAAVSLMNEIKRTFMYHGAEHKTIFCYEHGIELTVENVRKESRFHPRCGTSFLILMLLVGLLVMIPVGLVLKDILPEIILGNKVLYALTRMLFSIIILPLIMGIGYELIKIAGKHDNLLVRIISAPGLWLQRITTKEPDDDMIECAIVALKKVIPDDGSDKL